MARGVPGINVRRQLAPDHGLGIASHAAVEAEGPDGRCGPMGTGRGPASEAVGMQRAPGVGALLDGPPVTAHAVVDAVVTDGLKGSHAGAKRGGRGWFVHDDHPLRPA